MAELAVPILALGAMYILSNGKNDEINTPGNEGFSNQYIGEDRLPNTDLPPNNYPVEDMKDINQNVARYSGMKNTVDEMYLPENYQAALKTEEDINFKSLTGEIVQADSLEHNNMVPFFGSKVTQNIENTYEGVLDFHTGAGSQQQEKRGIAPMFTPEKNMSWIHGAPNNNDYLQERMRGNVTSKMNNVKPWDEIRVAPGLNKGYGIEGSGGFNSGLESRDSWRPKTVDELRVETNPKMSYGGVFLGPKGKNERGIEGKMEKNRPERFYENTSDRWFTTTGLEKAQRARGTIVMQPENRSTTTREYFGGGGKEFNAIYQKENYQESRRNVLDPYSKYLGAATKRNGWEDKASNYGKGGYTAHANARTINKQTENLGPAGSIISALTAPIMDMLRPSRKQNVIGNKRQMGNARGPQTQPVFNPADTTRTTIREQTEATKYIIQGGQNKNAGHTTNQYQPVSVQRDTTNCQYIGNSSAGDGTTKPQVYSDYYNNSNLNPNKEVVSKVDRFNQGNHNLYNNYQNLTTMSNTASQAAPMLPNMPKSISSISNYGQISGKNTREIHMNRNTNAMVSALNSNPFAKSLHSVA